MTLPLSIGEFRSKLIFQKSEVWGYFRAQKKGCLTLFRDAGAAFAVKPLKRRDFLFRFLSTEKMKARLARQR